MSQRLDAERLLERIQVPSEGLVRDLEDVLERALNGPPLGEADGSISKEAWMALREIVKCCRTLQQSRESFLRLE
jgi:hypothetical protein